MPKSVRIISPAKLNLCLDILKKDRSGYHQIQTVFHEEKSLCDIVKINESKEIDSLSIVKAPSFPKNRLSKDINQNLALKALQLIKFKYKIKKIVQIEIQKNIPYSSGLGGASSNAAAVLKGLNKLWKLQLTTKELLKLAAKLGSDVPFFIIGGTAFGTHYGEIVQPLNPIKGIEFKIHAKSSGDRQKTKTAYANLDLKKCGQNLEKTREMLLAINQNDPQKILKNLHNDFEIAGRDHLCGSGPSTFEAKIATL